MKTYKIELQLILDETQPHPEQWLRQVIEKELLNIEEVTYIRIDEVQS